MLAQLRIRDLVLFEELDLELSKGFNVLTGETGAGKSLVATAIDLLLGRRATGSLVRRGAKEAEVEGLFDISDEPDIKSRLVEAGLAEEDELLVRRIVPANGRHRCYVNGKLASLSVLSNIAAGLANVMSQHEQYDLMDPAKQIGLLDLFGGLGAKLENMAQVYGQLSEADRRVKDLHEKESEKVQRLDYLSYQLEEIDRLAPRPGEIEELEQEIDRLKHQELLSSTAKDASLILYDADKSVYEQLGTTSTAVENAARYDEAFKPVADALSEALALVEDAARTMSGYGSSLDDDGGTLTELEDRREELQGLVRKHGVSLAEIVDLRDRIAEEVSLLNDYEAAIAKAEQLLADLKEKAEKQAREISKERKKVARKLSKTVSAELGDLELGGAEFQIQVDNAPSGIGPSGTDRVEFSVALNPGEGSHPLRKVASGGELSRLMLSIKRALAGVGPVGTYVFDEVDSGIGGAVAAAVGRKLSEVSGHHQVICITHLPQISGMADNHFFVSKVETSGRTAAKVVKLETRERVEELARMLGGEKVTAKTKAAAKELLRPAASVN